MLVEQVLFRAAKDFGGLHDPASAQEGQPAEHVRLDRLAHAMACSEGRRHVHQGHDRGRRGGVLQREPNDGYCQILLFANELGVYAVVLLLVVEAIDYPIVVVQYDASSAVCGFVLTRLCGCGMPIIQAWSAGVPMPAIQERRGGSPCQPRCGVRKFAINSKKRE